MDNSMERLDAYLNGLESRGEKIPCITNQKKPLLRVISAKAGIAYRKILNPEYKRRINFAVEKIGLEKRDSSTKVRSVDFERNCKKIQFYLKYLETSEIRLPEDPEHNGEVFFEQIECESGLNRQDLILHGTNRSDAYRTHLREIINSAIPHLGLEVRVLPHTVGSNHDRITYEQLFEKGTAERKHQLENKPNGRQQLYNARGALNLFLKVLKLTATELVSPEFVSEFSSNVERVLDEIENANSRKKFKTEIRRWHDFYHRIVNELSIPNDFHEAVFYLVDKSGLSLSVLSKIIGMSRVTLAKWCDGSRIPTSTTFKSLYRAEALFNLPHGTLFNKIVGLTPQRRFRTTDLPEFLKKVPHVIRKIRPHLPDNFCELTIEKQEEIANSIYADITRSNDLYAQKLKQLRKLSYRLKEWPLQLEQEFKDLTTFKTGVRPPIGMKRKGVWKPVTVEMRQKQLSFLFGSICLPPNSEDCRLRGLGIPPDQLTMALIACPQLIDWYIRFICEVRTSYTGFAVNLIIFYMSLTGREAGWLRQRPDLALRLRPVSCDNMELVSQALV